MLLRYEDKRVVLMGEREVMALAPAGRVLRLSVEPGATVSIYPLLPVTGIQSRGLAWPIDGLAFAPGQLSGTSNRAEQSRIELSFDGPGALVLLPRTSLASLAGAITA